MRTRSLTLLAAVALMVPAAMRAQGTLSTLGFGYPSGGLSTRSLGAGGALGEMDPLSASNPAVISYFGGSILYFQAEPEYRTLHVGGKSENTSIARYPLIVAAYPLTQTMMLGLSVSSLLDRSFETRSRGSQQIGDSLLATSTTFKSDGAIGDLRLALSWAPRTWLRLGAAGHAVTGDNRVRNQQVFDDSTRFAALVDTATVGYTGNAFSAGFELLAARNWSFAGSYRRGGHLSLKRGDTTLTNANVPDRLGLSLAFVGIRGTTLAVRSAKDTWSRMKGLGSANLKITDSWDTSLGADILGPRLGERTTQVRLGVRERTLPFGLPTFSVKERSYSAGAGMVVARGRAAFDLAGIRATRDAGTTGSESAWTLSFGVMLRP